MDDITLHTTHCPRCEVLREKLLTAGICFRTNTNTDLMLEKEIEHVPVLEVNGTLLGFAEAVKYVSGGVAV